MSSRNIFTTNHVKTLSDIIIMYYQNTEPKNDFTLFIKKPVYNPLLKWISLASVLAASALMFYTTQMFGTSEITNLSVTYGDLFDEDKLALFEEFKQKFSKHYDSDEENVRFENFKNFLTRVDANNLEEQTGGKGLANHGITKFADLSADEFKTNYLGYIAPILETRNIVSVVGEATTTVMDWSGIYTTAVKDQGYCGSCWAFSATEQIESDSIRLGLLSADYNLSPEQIVQCDTVDDGCDGGNTATAFEYVQKAGGLQSDADYPYTSYYDVTGTCVSNSSEYVVTVSSYYSIEGEENMATHVLTTGPLSICLSAETWATYTSGILTTCPTEVDHCVQAVGVNLDDNYWIVRNSWGTDWGLDGYIWLEYGSDLCSIAYDPKYVKTELV